VEKTEFCQQVIDLWSRPFDLSLILQQDPFYARITPSEGVRLIKKAEHFGQQQARWYRQHTEELQELMATLQLRRLPEAREGQRFYTFAEFNKQDQISLDWGLLEKAQSFMDSNHLDLTGVPLSELVLMHEVFHAIEYKKNLWTTEKHLQYQIAFMKKSVRVYGLSEIAASCFVQEFFQLTNAPVLLEVCLLYPKNPQLAVQKLAFFLGKEASEIY
jgi:hypothetical protein